MAAVHGETWGLYARVSSKRQVEDGLSIDAQLAALHAFAQQHGYTAREFVDAGKSAWRDNLDKRPACKEMLDAARAGEIQGVAVTHLDRLSRNLIVTLTILGELGQKGVGFVSLENAAFDFSRPADRLLMAVLGAFAEYYSNELSRKIRRGLAHRAAQGLRNGLLPFGFCNGKCVDCKHDNPRCARWASLSKDAVALHPDDAPGVLLAFETYRQSSASFDDVADVLNAAGYRSRTARGRVLWNKHSIAEILRNITYTGIVIHNGKEIAGQFPGIITRELFDQVAAIRRKRKSHQTTFNRKYRVYLFGGLLKCAGCGRVMVALTRGKSQRLCYHCKTRELRHADCPAQNTWVYEDGLAAQFAELVAQSQLPADWQARVAELVNGNGKAQRRENDKQTLTDRLARLKKQFEWGDIGEQEYTARRDEIKRALAACDPPAARAIVDAAKYLQNMAAVWQAATAEEQRDMVRAILDEVICDPDARRLIALKPKPAFGALFRQVSGLVERDGRFDIKAGVGDNSRD